MKLWIPTIFLATQLSLMGQGVATLTVTNTGLNAGGIVGPISASVFKTINGLGGGGGLPSDGSTIITNGANQYALNIAWSNFLSTSMGFLSNVVAQVAEPFNLSSATNLPLVGLAQSGASIGQSAIYSALGWVAGFPTASYINPSLQNPNFYGTSSGVLSLPTVNSNAIYQTFILDTFGPAAYTNQELTGFYCDGTNAYYLFNAGSITTATNGYKLYVTNINGTGFGVVNYGQLGVGAFGFNEAAGLKYHAGKLYANVIEDPIGPTGNPALSNAVCVFNTNGTCLSVNLLGQQPRSLQNVVFFTNGLAGITFFNGTNAAGDGIGGTNDLYAASTILVYDPTTWLTNGHTPITLQNPIGIPLVGIDLGGDSNTLTIFCSTQPFPSFDSPQVENDIYATFTYLINTNGFITPYSYEKNTNGLAGGSIGSWCYMSNDFTKGYGVFNWVTNGDNANVVLGFSMVASNDYNSIQATGISYFSQLAVNSNSWFNIANGSIGAKIFTFFGGATPNTSFLSQAASLGILISPASGGGVVISNVWGSITLTPGTSGNQESISTGSTALHVNATIVANSVIDADAGISVGAFSPNTYVVTNVSQGASLFNQYVIGDGSRITNLQSGGSAASNSIYLVAQLTTNTLAGTNGPTFQGPVKIIGTLTNTGITSTGSYFVGSLGYYLSGLANDGINSPGAGTVSFRIGGVDNVVEVTSTGINGQVTGGTNASGTPVAFRTDTNGYLATNLLTGNAWYHQTNIWFHANQTPTLDYTDYTNGTSPITTGANVGLNSGSSDLLITGTITNGIAAGGSTTGEQAFKIIWGNPWPTTNFFAPISPIGVDPGGNAIRLTGWYPSNSADGKTTTYILISNPNSLNGGQVWDFAIYVTPQ